MSSDLADKGRIVSAATQECVDTLTICCHGEALHAVEIVLRHNYRLEDVSGERRCSGRDCVVLEVRTVSMHRL